MSSEFFDLPPITKEVVGGRLRANMDMLKQQNVYEHTLYKKWKYLRDFREHPNLSEVVKANIWTPSDIHDQQRTMEEINNLKPSLHYVNTRQLYKTWFTLKLFLSSFPPTMPPGRVLNFILEDENTGHYLGVVTVASDVINLGARDRWIGWTTENKLDDGKLQCSPSAHMIISTQPFGYNFLGGKLIASLLTMNHVRDLWKEVTGKPMVGLTTTSLYGASSQYNGIPYWKTLGESVGKVLLLPDDEFYKECLPWIKEQLKHMKVAKKLHINKEKQVNSLSSEWFTPSPVAMVDDKGGPVTNAKQKMLKMILNEMGIKAVDYMHGFRRGVFYAPLYINSREFLRSEINESQLVLSPRLADDIDGVVEWWRKKAIKRYTKLSQDGRIKPEIMYYDDLKDLTWLEAKRKYLMEVGR